MIEAADRINNLLRKILRHNHYLL
ncbi:hypothetical protein BOS5A_211195 [Bosea sp. EC-HK365B]|nr:hypothetical protein BOSE21B_50496 [Bosea sp. 21B]CAD5300950.1 hypothetical protein BOSE7B_90196 [Bosea sp. 7B]VVT60404.1 hypothetical protein BOS5A_211195 [Bosea sp. EC-HK365B]VXB59959.1 hypothetical protein BOSE127_140139 [Bosea sp. 127]